MIWGSAGLCGDSSRVQHQLCKQVSISGGVRVLQFRVNSKMHFTSVASTLMRCHKRCGSNEVKSLVFVEELRFMHGLPQLELSAAG